MESDNNKNEEPKLIQDIEHAHPEIKLIEDVEHAHPEEKRSLWKKLKRIFKRK